MTGCAVCSGKYPPLPERLSPAVRDLLGRMLVVDVERRILLEEIVSHEWYLASVDGNGDRNFRVRSPPTSPTAPAAAKSTSASMRCLYTHRALWAGANGVVMVLSCGTTARTERCGLVRTGW